MSIHVGEISTQVETHGLAAAAAPTGAPAKEWDEREKHRRLAEEEARRSARLSAGGFDG